MIGIFSALFGLQVHMQLRGGLFVSAFSLQEARLSVHDDISETGKTRRTNLWNFSIAQLTYCRLSSWHWVPVLASGVQSTCWKVTATITPAQMVLIYLEELVCYLIVQKKTWKTEYHEENTYKKRKAYLLRVLEECDLADYMLAKEIIDGIEKIPECYFVSGTRASIPIKEMTEGNFLTTLARALDKNVVVEHEINHNYYVRLSFVGLSTGEAQYLDLHAALYQAIKSSQDRHHSGDTCVLLLDEPDCRFHPEWSRNFIQSLRELLNTKTFREYRYQIIISTHSPLLVSDAVKDSIHCLHRNDDNNVSVQSSNYGLMSNLSNLFTDTFFSQSVFGAFAEQYANTLIKDINTAIQNPNSVTEDQIEEMRNRTYLIEDTVIRKSLDIMLRRVVYRRK